MTELARSLDVARLQTWLARTYSVAPARACNLKLWLRSEEPGLDLNIAYFVLIVLGVSVE